MIKKTMMGLGVATAILAGGLGTAEAGTKHGFSFKIQFGPSYGYSCGWMKQKALKAEYRGQWYRANYWWDRYWDCRNGY